MHAARQHEANAGARTNDDVQADDAMRQLKVAQEICSCARMLLHADVQNDSIAKVLEDLRRIAVVKALSIFQQRLDANGGQTFEWLYQTGREYRKTSGKTYAHPQVGAISDQLAARQPVFVAFPDNHKTNDAASGGGDGDQCRLIFPIDVFGKWWGGLCLYSGSMDVEKGSSLFEAFATAADFLGVFIERQIASRDNAESDKLAGALEMAGTVCHKLNQPMQVILGYASMVTSGDIREPEQVCEIVKMIEDETRRMGIITKNLMGITKYRTVETPDVGSMCDVDNQSVVG